MIGKGSVVRMVVVGFLATVLGIGCGESGGTAAAPEQGAGIPGLRGPAATPKTKKGGPARAPTAPAKPAEPKPEG